MNEQVAKIRSELRNIRQAQRALKEGFKKDLERLSLQMKTPSALRKGVREMAARKADGITFSPIGHIESVYTHKNGTPRQGSLCGDVESRLVVSAGSLNNPEHSLIGLAEFSHVWLLFHFHHNSDTHTRTKVHPPRMRGASVGVFATRSPHRPNAIGLTLASLLRVEGNILHLRHVDLLHETPILDIKPYIPSYDVPPSLKRPHDDEEEKDGDDDDGGGKDEKKTYDGGSVGELRTAGWLAGMDGELEVLFTRRAEEGLKRLARFRDDGDDNDSAGFRGGGDDDSADGVLQRKVVLCRDVQALKKAIVCTLRNDPRSVYRRQQCADRLYYFLVDGVHVTCWFDEGGGGRGVAEVLRVHQ